MDKENDNYHSGSFPEVCKDLIGKNGIRFRGGDNGPFWESRDYGLPTIPCTVAKCPACENRKCTMPSAIIIGPDGKCQLGKKAIEENKDG